MEGHVTFAFGYIHNSHCLFLMVCVLYYSRLCTLLRVKCIIQRSKSNLFVSVDQFDQIVPSFLVPGPQDLMLRLLWSVEHDEL